MTEYIVGQVQYLTLNLTDELDFGAKEKKYIYESSITYHSKFMANI